MKFTALLMAFLISLLCTSCNRESTETSQHEEPQTQEEIERERARLSWQRAGEWAQGVEHFLEELGPDGYITWNAHYGPQDVDDNVHLLEEWVSSFEQGNATPTLHIKAKGVDGPWLIQLDYDGGEHYTFTVFRNGRKHISSSPIVTKRTFDYVFWTDISERPYGSGELLYSFPHTDMLIEEVDYDLEAMPPLGSIGPGKACEILHEQGCNPYNVMTVSGAVKINGEYYYEIEAYYVKADGNIVISYWHGCRVMFDANTREIRPPEQG